MTPTLTLETFTPLVGSAFSADTGGGRAVLLTLAATRALPAPPGDRGRPPFALDFLGPAEPAFAQQTLALDHPQLGRVDIFVVPVARDASGTSYEAIFT